MTAPALAFGKLPARRRQSRSRPAPSQESSPRNARRRYRYGREEYERDVKDLQRRFASMRLGIDL